jgi:peptide/nickel transport system permease protein
MKFLIYKILFLILVLSILGSLILKENSKKINLDLKFKGPSFEHPLGTDELGRDIFLRTITALGNSSLIVLIASFISIFFGILIGGITGISENKKIKYIFENTFNLLWALPGIPFFVAILTYFPRNIFSVAITISTLAWIVPARTLRFIIESEKRKLYVLALKSFGYSKLDLIKFIIYNIKEPFILSTLFTFIDILVTELSLSFLGLSIQPPEPSLGSMIYNSINYLNKSIFLFIAPFGALIFLLISLFSIINEIQKSKYNIFQELML